jgi:hypothetical protein
VLPGIPYGEAIIDGINRSRILVLVFSINSNSSPQVMREIERAVHKGIPIIPLRIDEVIPTKAMEYFVSAAHWLDAMTPPLERHLQRLGETIQVLLSNETGETLKAEPTAAIAQTSQQRPWWKKSKGLYAIVGSAFTIALIIVGVKFGFASHNTSPGTITTTTQTPVTPTPTQSAPPTSNIVSTPIQAIPISANSQLLYQDNFSDPNSGWLRYSDDTKDISYDNGEYSLTVKKANWSQWCTNRGAGQFKDLVYEVDARLFSGSNETSYGLVFRAQDDSSSFYSFTVSGEGNCSIRKRVSGAWIVIKDWSQLYDWPQLTHVNTGKTVNHLKVVIKGNQIDLYINGYLLASIIDAQFTQGYVGVLLITKTPPACGHFDNVRVSSVE